MKVLVSDNLGEAGIKMFQEEEGIDVMLRPDCRLKNLKASLQIMTGWSSGVRPR